MIVFSISNNIMMLMTSSPSFCITTLSSLSSSNFARYFPAQTDELVGHTDQIMHLSVNPQPEISRNQICAARQPQLALTLALKATPITCSESIYCDVAQENRQHIHVMSCDSIWIEQCQCLVNGCIHTHTCMCVYIYIYTYKYIYIYVCVTICVYMCIHTYIHDNIRQKTKNTTDRQADGQTNGQTDGRTGIQHPPPSPPPHHHRQKRHTW